MIALEEYQIGEQSRVAGASYEDIPVIKQYGEEEGIIYPCIYVTVAPDELRQHRLMVLSNLVNVVNPLSKVSYPLYIEVGDSVNKLGMMDTANLRVFLTSSIFASWNISIHCSAQEIYVGDACLAFCALT